MLSLIGSAVRCGDGVIDVVDPDRGLLAHWTFDEGPSTTVADSSGFGLDGTPSPNPPMPTPDVPPVHFPNPYSFSFNAMDQWVAMGNPPILNLGGPITVAAWIRPEALDGTRDIVAHGYNADATRDLALRIKSGLYEFTYWDGQEHDAIVTAPDSDLGSWVHLCGAFNGTSYVLYRNGELAGSTADATAPSANYDAVWGIGAHVPQPTGPDRRFLGLIDDVRIYGRALTAAEALALYSR